MKLQSLVLLASVGLFCSAHPVGLKWTADNVNGGIGLINHLGWRVCGGPNERLKPENEKMVRDLMEKMGISKTIDIYRIPKDSGIAYVMGNNIYIDEEYFFEDGKDRLDEARFVIGHELIHAEKNHVLLGILAKIGAFTFCKSALQYTGIGNFLYSATKKWVPLNDRCRNILSTTTLAGATLCSAGYLVIAFSRRLERQADTEALTRLAPFYGKDALVQAGASFFAREGFHEDPLPGLAIHPSCQERLRYLGLSKDYVASHGEHLMPALKDLLVESAYKEVYRKSVKGADLPDTDFLMDNELDVYMQRLSKRILKSYMALQKAKKSLKRDKSEDADKQLEQARNMVSVYKESAQKMIERLKGNEVKKFVDDIIAYLKHPRRRTPLTAYHKKLLSTLSCNAVKSWDEVRKKLILSANLKCDDLIKFLSKYTD